MGVNPRYPSHLLSDGETRQIRRVIEEHSEISNGRDLVVFDVLRMTGRRLGSVVRMNLQQLDLEKGVWVIPARNNKIKKEDTVYLCKEIVVVLKDWVSDRREDIEEHAGFLFFSTRHNGKYAHITTTVFTRNFRKYVDLAGLGDIQFTDSRGYRRRRRHPHCLRGYFARKLFGTGLRVNEVACLTGHRSLDCLNRFYLRLQARELAREVFPKVKW